MNTRALTLAFRIGVRQALEQPFAVLGQLLVLIVLLLSYGAILKAIPSNDLARMHLTSTQMIWYICMTETVMMLGLWHCRKFQNDIAAGLIDVWMLRPTSFWMLLLAEWAGEEVIRLLPILAVSVTLGRLISGDWPNAAPAIVLILPTIIGGMALLLCSAILLGLATLWIGNTTAAFFIYYKFIFVFGALLWPMAFYPRWLLTLSWLTPFPSILADTSDLVLPISYNAVIFHALQQVFWIAVMLICCKLAAEAARKKVARS